MKRILGLLLVTSLSISAQAEKAKKEKGEKAERQPAEYQSVELTKDGEKQYFKNCGDSAEAHFFKRSEQKAVVRLTGITGCTNYQTSKETGKIPGMDNQPRSIDFEFLLVPGRTTVVEILVKSNSGKNSAKITARVESKAQAQKAQNILSVGRPMTLTNCGGKATLKKSSSQGEDQYNIKIEGMASCNKFDILEANGSSIAYSAKDIQSDNASFTLPKKVVARGLSFNDPLLDLLFGNDEPNLIKVRFYNAYMSSKQDIVYLYFYDQGNADDNSSATEVKLF